MIFLALLAACIQDHPLPDLGPCADYPAGVYEYGQIGIGTCLAGPTEIHFVDNEDGEPILMVSNANPYQLFDGGSLLAIPWDAVDPTVVRQRVSDLGATALDLPNFAGGFDLAGDLALITVRLSENARVRQVFDEVHLVDLTDPMAPAPANRGPGGASTLTVQSDPIDVVVDPASGYAFVANRTSHSISVLDTTGDEITVVKPWPTYGLSSARFVDADGSGSRAELAELAVFSTDNLVDDTWTLSWVAGTWRLWLPLEGSDAPTGGLQRYDHQGDSRYSESPLGVELDPEDSSGLVDTIHDPSLRAGSSRMFFVSEGRVRAASSGVFLGDWGFETAPLIAPPDGRWDEDPGGPASVVDSQGLEWIFYDGGGTDGRNSPGIGAAWSADGVVFQAADDLPLLLPGASAHDAVAIADPDLFFDTETRLWRMVYGAWDGARWTLGQAWSEDLRSWTPSTEALFALDGVDVAAPVISGAPGDWRLWYAPPRWGRVAGGPGPQRRCAHWVDGGVVADFADWSWTGDDPPGIALEAAPNPAFRVRGEAYGQLDGNMLPGFGFVAGGFGWRGVALAGYALGPGDFGSASWGGVSLGSVSAEAGLAWLGLTSAGGTPRIGAATLDDDGQLSPIDGPLDGAIFEGSEAHDRDGASSPVVLQSGSSYTMFYAAHRGSTRTVGSATSSDGLTWTRGDRLLGLGADGSFDAVAVEPGSAILLDDGRVRLWYSGFDGEIWRIGSAIAAGPGQRFVRETGPSRAYQLGTGTPGDWDDSGVRHPFVIRDAEGQHIWYSGFDGSTWRLGYAFRPNSTSEFERAQNLDGLSRPILDPALGTFEPTGVGRPVLLADGDSLTGWYTGDANGSGRVGGMHGLLPDRINRAGHPPTVGDSLSFTTQRGDADATAIPLDTSLPDADIYGVGLAALSLDSERGFLYAVSKLAPFVVVVDIRDDSTDSFQDLNYLDVEALILYSSAGGADGFRQVLPVAGTNLLYGLNDSPEAVWISDISGLVDDARADVLYDSTIGFLPSPRGRERDAGNDTQMSIGPGQMALHPDGRRLFVTNFNANSVSVYDLALGNFGQEIAEVNLVGENPYAIAISPDGRQAVIANYTGGTTAAGLTESTLGVLDIDPDSPSYLQMVTWVVNR